MKSDERADLAQWLDSDDSRITALAEIFGSRPESEVKSSLLEIFDRVPEVSFVRQASLLNALRMFEADMQKIQSILGIPPSAVGHAAMVLANAEAIWRRFPFPLRPRYGTFPHLSVRASSSLTRL
jgi:hypothetical protein